MKRGTKITESSLNRLNEYSKKKYNIQNSRELTTFFYHERHNLFLMKKKESYSHKI